MMNTIDLMLHCALACALKRRDSPNYDRNRTVYTYFAKYRFIAKGRDRAMAKLICSKPDKSAYFFDQYFGMIMRQPAGPDAHDAEPHLLAKFEELSKCH